MITELYNRLTEVLRSVTDDEGRSLINHIDLWNQNVEFIEEDEAWARPAVFVEFGEILWEPLKGPALMMRGRGEVLLHVVTDWKGSVADGSGSRNESLEDYTLPELIHDKVARIEGSSFRNVHLSRTIINHNHQELLENIEVYSVTYQRTLC